MSSEVEICNRGLQKIGAKRITALNTEDKNSRACSFVYPILRDSLLRQHTWGFSIKRASLAALSTGPIFGRTNYFPLPSDFLRLVHGNNHEIDWSIESAPSGEVCITTDWDAPLEIRYVSQITDPDKMDELFREALSAYIAAELVEELTQSNTKKQILLQEAQSIIAEAKKTSSIEEIAQQFPEVSWITVRGK